LDLQKFLLAAENLNVFCSIFFYQYCKNSLMPQYNVYFKCTSTLPDPKGPLFKEVPTISIMDAIVIKYVVYFKFFCTRDTKYGNSKAFTNINSKYFFWERFSQHCKHYLDCVQHQENIIKYNYKWLIIDS